jgi:hypothetical protein
MPNTVKIFRGFRRIVVFPKVVLREVYPHSVLLSIQQIQRDFVQRRVPMPSARRASGRSDFRGIRTRPWRSIAR